MKDIMPDWLRVYLLYEDSPRLGEWELATVPEGPVSVKISSLLDNEDSRRLHNLLMYIPEYQDILMAVAKCGAEVDLKAKAVSPAYRKKREKERLQA